MAFLSSFPLPEQTLFLRKPSFPINEVKHSKMHGKFAPICGNKVDNVDLVQMPPRSTRRNFFVESCFAASLAVGAFAFQRTDEDDRARLFKYRAFSDMNGIIYDTRRTSYLPPSPTNLNTFSDEEETGVVCIGEIHNNKLHHLAQLDIIKALRSLDDIRPMAIGMEMVMRKDQQHLDAFIRREIGLWKLFKRLDWDASWGFDYQLYAPILRFARMNNIPLVGLNAPQTLVHQVARRGLSGLSADERAELPEMDLNNKLHMTQFFKTMMGPGGAHNHLDMDSFLKYYQAKTLWDEYMSESVARYIETSASFKEGGRFVVLAGNGHIEGRTSIPDRIQRRTGTVPFVVVPQSVAFEDAWPVLQGPLPDKTVADWVWFTRRPIDLV
mmetsp:Transcript_24330/g.39988  ORF Transcript_24330/g.39988 Transcript_24330/m.39988 type:complete len:383 (+) Transcript_24330:180-1328(+)|eukprot:CAMPEP_0184368518 /NCGR_PEP_ID=MMETSP1089-20130417/161704_1 /TAXON_ID=38269 ORGANISM="Gloeochaete wittrockiana, Strain SAG46.84" /NCGR_SAMPLE_ID=MMETSP1089 /ASSEMBLY_ACC=CAM_ASM_000445 /LENGTH=382 /DNA_ID=CAMNT_0026710817 /DNA_START=140 /DNA_END=1288 /DNA_ORIENTATION=+